MNWKRNTVNLTVPHSGIETLGKSNAFTLVRKVDIVCSSPGEKEAARPSCGRRVGLRDGS
jgi:hypothetical protein